MLNIQSGVAQDRVKWKFAISKRLILKTSAMLQMEFQSAIFELSQRILNYDKKYSYQLEGTWVVIEKTKVIFICTALASYSSM